MNQKKKITLNVKNFYIYRITNTINGKKYVGQHYRRYKTDKYFASGMLINRAVKKYGKENFTREIIHDNIQCQTAANIYEKQYIKKEESLHPIGYNLTAGGNNGLLTQYVKDKISESSKGKTKSESHIEHIREASIANKSLPPYCKAGFWDNKKGAWKDKHITQAMKDAISKDNKEHPRDKDSSTGRFKLKPFTFCGVEYISSAEATRITGVSYHNMRMIEDPIYKEKQNEKNRCKRKK